ncbi:DUF6428 family protein [Devosia naphthalenivorans]|uniref:DUF6428 family protein n=1 Tax=Devosia naphthalenivorans TaxID=2082392 RepID=UPI000D369B7E|nr:DUF6428 family protein [Devosia naphthalenivorans]
MSALVTQDPTTSSADFSLARLLHMLEGHDEKALVIEYAGRRIGRGYHVTEVKAGSFVTLDCGGNPDAWQETVLQVEDISAESERTFMQVGKFTRILAQVDRKIPLNGDARVTFEVSRPGEPMQVFDLDQLAVDEETVVLQLEHRSAICKPRHRAAQQAVSSGCCAPAAKSPCCS